MPHGNQRNAAIKRARRMNPGARIAARILAMALNRTAAFKRARARARRRIAASILNLRMGVLPFL
jgi:hypothetical protein